MELQQCSLCSVQLEMSEYFTHGTEIHGIFSCLYCHRQFKFSKELMVHLNREHKVPTQKFSNGADFLNRGGKETSLLCVECNKIFQSDELTTFMKYHAQECRKSTGICPKCGSVLLLSLLGEHIVHCQGGTVKRDEDTSILSILIRELADKLKDYVTESSSSPVNDSLPLSTPTANPATTNGSSTRYELLVNYNLESKAEDEILNDMIMKSCVDCAYCRLVRLIRIDKRQLVIHLLSKHSWDLRVLRTPAMVLKSIMESRNDHLTENTEQPENKTEVADEKIQWIDFKLALLQKVFRSQNVVYTFTGEKLGEFGEIPCECLLCGFLADSQKNLFPHWRRIHRSVAMKCTMCKGRFLFAGALYSHLCLGTPEPLTLKEVSDDHEESSDTVGWRYQCSICENQKLPGFFNYMVHIRSDHNKCELCLETLNTQKDLEHHMKKHKLNHFCWKCSVTYCAKPNFMTHLFWKHGTESVDCSKCLKKKWPHIYHFCVPPDYFVCDVCGLHFTRPKALIVHKRLHTGEKLRKCPKTSCQERFISKKLLQKHLDSVHGKVAIDSVVPTPDPLPTGDDVKAEDPTTTENTNTNMETTTTMNTMNTTADSSTTEVSPTSELKSELTKEEEEGPIAVKEDPDSAPDVESSNTTENKVEHNHVSPEPVKPSKPFNLAEIQGPNLSEAESDSDSDSDGVDEPKLQPTNNVGNSSINNNSSSTSKDVNICNDHGDPKEPTMGSLFSTTNSFIKNEADYDKLVENGVSDSGSPKNDNLTSSSIQPKTEDINDGIGLDALDNSNDSMTEKTGRPFLQSSSLLLDDLDTMKQSDEAMSPLLPPLDDFNFSVPEIPTFEENHLPEHIIRENAMFSIQHEHDYCQQSLVNVNLKRKIGAPTNFYGNGHVAHHGRGDLNAKISPSRSRGRPKKLKVRKPSKKSSGKKRRRSSSSSSSSSSSCSSCGSNCSCSSSSSGSSSSSSNSDSSDNEGHHHRKSKSKAPIKITLPKIKTVKGSTSKKLKKNNGSVAVGGKIVNNGEIIKRPRGAPRKYKKAKVPKLTAKAAKEINENIKPVNPVDTEPYILESDLETDESGSEEIFHQKQLTENIGSVNPLIDEVWDMGSEKYLLKLIRGVQNLEELRPPPPVKKEEIKYSLLNSGAPQSKLKVRNVPIKPLIVKRNVHSNFNMGNFKDLTVVPQKDSFPLISGSVRPFKTSPVASKVKKNTAVTISRTPPSAVKAPLISSAKSKIVHKKAPAKIIKKPAPPTFDNSLPSFTGHVAVGDESYLQQPSTIPPATVMSSNSDRQSSPTSTPPPPTPPPTNKRGPRGSGSRKSVVAKDKLPALAKPKKTALVPAEAAYVDEKLYCICQCPHDNVSQMIGCDYKGCQYKWFHFECVGILIPPKGKWYCSECREIVRQKKAAAAVKVKEEESKQEIGPD